MRESERFRYRPPGRYGHGSESSWAFWKGETWPVNVDSKISRLPLDSSSITTRVARTHARTCKLPHVQQSAINCINKLSASNTQRQRPVDVVSTSTIALLPPTSRWRYFQVSNPHLLLPPHSHVWAQRLRHSIPRESQPARLIFTLSSA
jgi:hypothetical protein